MATIKRGLLLLTASAVALILAEVVVRVGGLAPEVAFLSVGRFQLSEDPRIGYEPIPDFDYQGDDLFYYEFRGGSNRAGFRGPDPSPDPEYRVVALGDSITMGLRIEDDAELYTHHLAQALDVEVLNFGVSGYNTPQEVATLETRALHLQPDLVLLQYCLNDRQQMNGGIVKRLQEAEAASVVDTNQLGRSALSKSELWLFLRFAVFREGLQVERGERRRALEELAKDGVEEGFHELARLGAEHGFAVLVVVFPRLLGESEAEHREYATLQGYADDAGLEFLLLDDAMELCRQEQGEIALDYLHPNAAGHRCAAEAIAPRIAELRRAP